MIPPPSAHATIVEQVIAPASGDVPLSGLPRLDIGEDLPRDVLRRLGWVNYFSDAAATRIGFVGDATFASVRRVAGGWLAQLTAEPLNLKRRDHLEALRTAYARLPALGRRRAPSALRGIVNGAGASATISSHISALALPTSARGRQRDGQRGRRRPGRPR